MKLKASIFLLMVLFLYSNVPAQDEVEKWLQKEQQALEDFLSKEDKAFIEFLKKEWKEFQLFQGLKVYQTPKPLTLPVYVTPEDNIEPEKESRLIEQEPDAPEVNDKKGTGEELDPGKTGSSNVNIETDDIPVTESGSLRIDPVKNPVQIDLDFYGTTKEVKISNELKVMLDDDPDGETIGDFWEEIASKNYYDFLIQTYHYREQMNLNDWGYCVLLNDLANDIYGQSKDDKNLFLWFMLNKSGYKAKVGLIDNKVHLFIPASNKLYGLQYFSTKQDKERLYVVDFDNLGAPVKGKLFTYEGDYEGADKLIDMNVYKPITIDNDYSEKELKFNYGEVDYSIPVKFNQNNIDFYRNYPYSNLDIYINAAVNRETYATVLKSCEKFIDGKSDVTAANMLLRFVQTAFIYEADLPNFGREKPLFVEETIYYNKSDCEDRSIMFAFLVYNLLDLDVVTITYPGHCAAAVKFKETVPGDYVKHNGENYVVCDPTFINADVGMTMTKYKGKRITNIYELK